MFLCRVRKSMKGQAFCFEIQIAVSESRISTTFAELAAAFETCPCTVSRVRRQQCVQKNSYC
jgi:hypothetical protein